MHEHRMDDRHSILGNLIKFLFPMCKERQKKGKTTLFAEIIISPIWTHRVWVRGYRSSCPWCHQPVHVQPCPSSGWAWRWRCPEMEKAASLLSQNPTTQKHDHEDEWREVFFCMYTQQTSYLLLCFICFEPLQSPQVSNASVCNSIINVTSLLWEKRGESKLRCQL